MHNRKKKTPFLYFPFLTFNNIKKKLNKVNINFKQLKHVGYISLTTMTITCRKYCLKLLKPIIIQWFTKTALLDVLLLKLISKFIKKKP